MSEVKDRTLLLVQYVDTSEFLQGKKKKKANFNTEAVANLGLYK